MPVTALADPYAVVFDIGASRTYWGYSGDSEPRQCFSSAWLPESVAEFLEARVNVKPKFTTCFNGLPSPLSHFVRLEDPTDTSRRKDTVQGKLNCDLLERTMRHVNGTFETDALKDRSVFLTEPTKRSIPQMKSVAEVAFDRLGVGALSSARKAALSAFALGRLTASVCELGPLSMCITPVYEGYTLQKNLNQFATGGSFLDWILASLLQLYDNDKKSFDPQFVPYSKAKTQSGLLPSPGNRESSDEQIDPVYLHHSQLRIAADLKESVLSVKDRGAPAEDSSYELPDGKVLYVADSIATGLPEFLFNPQQAQVVRGFLQTQPAVGPLISSWPGLPTAIVANAFGCDADLRPALLQNIVLAGGGSALDGLTERLAADLTRLTRVDVGQRDYLNGGTDLTGGSIRDVSSFKFKIAARVSYERSFTSWIGASILSSLASYHSLWISKGEWQEVGPDIVERRAVF
eukprot:Protomagalhaensia_sp_Gyna_25__403@NODE_1190_length_2081_cov_1061_950539_g946_i0_p1_GENE_NODE_1190_length_2081_cov_1061_950539_g946_i0NODE_1190_length_2081_cov_1061_950539_g946_i0_p1_ORF_typecomplete_len462_score57_24Actin/PF00022_19/1_5e51MreB_Mbl/PF06723_13/0_0046Actin_micro/PF17003_5/0_036_NODE_1190_length_2081_cov_1061_950539_g946_i06622047